MQELQSRAAPEQLLDGIGLTKSDTPLALSFDRVSKFFPARESTAAEAGSFVALKNVSMEIRQGEFITLLGPSGCGKTTLLKMAAGLLRPDEGAITIAGRPVKAPRRDACMVFQNFGLLPWRTASGNVEFPLELDRVAKKERAHRARHYLQLVGLGSFPDHYPHELSGGMQQRVGIARAMMREPFLIFMDEPFGALDAQSREQLQLDFLKIWNAKRMTVLFVTHSIDEALVLSDRIFVFASLPGRLTSVVPSPFAADRLTEDIRSRPDFGAMRGELRKLLDPSRPDATV
ncbi:MAG: ABC transporter ATP-binding protein [Xanthobacteraceae bacterium]